MWIVHRADVGRVAFDRMVRDRVIAPLLPGIALPADVAPAPAVRRHVLADCVPHGCQVTGAAALWAHGLAALPDVVDVRTPPGRHVRNWSGPLAMRFHAVGIASEGADATPTDVAPTALAEVAVAGVDTARADARRWPARERPAQYGRRLAPVRRRAS